VIKNIKSAVQSNCTADPNKNQLNPQKTTKKPTNKETIIYRKSKAFSSALEIKKTNLFLHLISFV